MTFPACMILLPARHFKHSLSRTGWSVLQDFAHMTKKQREISNVCVCALFQSVQTRCIKTAQKMWASLYGGFVWRLASSTRHVSDQSWSAGGSHVLTQPSGLSDGEWHRVPSPDLCVRGEMERWENTRTMMRGSRRWEQEDNKTDIHHRLFGGEERKKKTMMAGRIRGWRRASGSSEGWRDLNGRDGRRLHVRIIGFFSTRSEYLCMSRSGTERIGVMQRTWWEKMLIPVCKRKKKKPLPP